MAERMVSVKGGPMDGKTIAFRCPTVKCVSEPILETYWDGEMFVHIFTEHTYRFDHDEGVYNWFGNYDPREERRG